MDSTDQRESFVRALCAEGARGEYAEKLTTYGRFVGSWEAEGTASMPDGTTRRHHWQIAFQWVLEGRAIQDVWITPPRHGAHVGQSEAWGPFSNQYGTTLRLYDPKTDSWHVTWNDPATGYRATLVGRPRGDEIFQEGTGSDGSQLRWIFSDITRDSFHWRAERLGDDGAWHQLLELRARRI
jgi:hypothetical protein